MTLWVLAMNFNALRLSREQSESVSGLYWLEYQQAGVTRFQQLRTEVFGGDEAGRHSYLVFMGIESFFIKSREYPGTLKVEIHSFTTSDIGLLEIVKDACSWKEGEGEGAYFEILVTGLSAELQAERTLEKDILRIVNSFSDVLPAEVWQYISENPPEPESLVHGPSDPLLQY